MTRFRTFLLFLCVGSSTLWGAAPLFHAYVADKWLEILEDYSLEEKQAFIRGTLFPDIRYIAKLARKITHHHGLTSNEIKKTSDPFLKGLRLHTYVDDVREAMVEQLGVISQLEERVPDDPYFLLKLIEDDILYTMLPKEKPLYYASCLKAIDPGALQFQVKPETIEQWHEIHKAYFQQSINQLLLEHIRLGKPCLGLSGAILNDFYEGVIEFRSHEKIREHVKKAIEQFELDFIHLRESISQDIPK